MSMGMLADRNGRPFYLPVVAAALGLATFFLTSHATSSYAQTMALSGQFAVGPTGAATYSIPIALPPGTAGMAPTLSLDYSSQAGNGLLGIGWTLAGLPSISRCPKTMAQDGALSGINYDANDRFCMEGQRLVAVSGTYGADGAQYRTEVDTFSKIISHGTAGSGPAWFEVRTKSGQVMEFGHTADSQILSQGKTSARIWAANKVSDTRANYLTVSYTNDPTNGQFYPIEIDYAGNAAAGVSPANKVQLVYATRPDIIPLYQNGSPMRTTVRLTDIKTYVGSGLVSDYRLAYQQSGILNRSRITSVTACDGGGACLPATTIGWSSSTGGFAAGQPWINYYDRNAGWTSNSVYPRMLADVNGDGLPDIVGFADSGAYVALNSGTSFASPQLWIAHYGKNDGYTNSDAYPRMLVDVNGDGLPDIVAFADIGVYVSLNTGTSFASPRQWIGYYDQNAGWTSNSVYPRMLADVNGDGLPDIVGFADSGAYVALNTGTSFASPQLWIAHYGKNDGYTNSDVYPRMLVDVNGDGLPDIVAFADIGVYVSLNTGTSFASPQQWIAGYGKNDGYTNSDAYPRVLVDVNGDGLLDIVAFADIGVYVSLNTGTSFAPGQPWVSYYDQSAGWTSNSVYPRMLADVNGDGLPDIVGFADSGAYVALNAGTSFGSPQLWIAHYGKNDGYTNSDVYPRMLADVTGAGYASILAFADTSVYVSLNTSSGPQDLVSSVTNGLGLATSITYATGTNNSVVTKGTGTTFPTMDLVGPISVVSRVDASNGVGGTYSSAYTYSGGRLDTRGRDFLGFQQTSTKDLQTNIVQTTMYRQDFPYIGLAASTTKSLNTLTLNRTATSYQFSNASGTSSVGAPSGAGAPYKVSVAQSVAQSSDLDGTALPSVTTTYQYDGFGNPTQVVASTPDGFSKTTTNTYTNDATHWLLGRLTRASVSSVAP